MTHTRSHVNEFARALHIHHKGVIYRQRKRWLKLQRACEARRYEAWAVYRIMEG